MPYEPLGVWLIDQWRQIGLNVKQEVIEAGGLFQHRCASGRLRGLHGLPVRLHRRARPRHCYKFLSTDRIRPTTAATRTRCSTTLYDKQSRATDFEERKQFVQQFEKRLLDEEAHYLMTLQWHRIIPHCAKVHGWTITPSHYLNNTARHGLAGAVT